MERLLTHPDAVRGLSIGIAMFAMVFTVAARGIEAEEQYPPFLRRYKIAKHVFQAASIGLALLAAVGLVYSQLA
ncbi:MAG TPA: hypothetical protein VGN05_00385 [Parvibaculum sp.]|jgi:hypothetical protein